MLCKLKFLKKIPSVDLGVTIGNFIPLKGNPDISGKIVGDKLFFL
jgi:hypothetical protein